MGKESAKKSVKDKGKGEGKGKSKGIGKKRVTEWVKKKGKESVKKIKKW